MDDDDSIRWNPDHFGHADFKVENDGQLTIFYEDAHEPPDPDDYPNLNAYEIAWAEWESKQVSQQPKGENQMFNFTAPIDTEIAQLQAKLAELEAQKQLLASRESCANKILADVEKCVVEMRGVVDEQSLFTWAESIFRLITGDALPQEKFNEAQDEFNSKIEELTENSYFKTLKINELVKERDEALAERDTLLERVQELEKLNQTNAKGIADLSQANLKLCEELNNLKGEPSENTTATEVDAKPFEDPAYLEAAKNQEIAANFLSKIDRKARALAVTWEKLKELPINADVMREIGLAARTKSHQILLDNMPQIITDYILKTGDDSDLGWLPVGIKARVEKILETADSDDIHEDDLDEMVELAQQESGEELHEDDAWEIIQNMKRDIDGFNPGDTVVMKNLESPDFDQVRKVLDCRQGWVNVKDDQGNTDLWLASDIELVDQKSA